MSKMTSGTSGRTRRSGSVIKIGKRAGTYRKSCSAKSTKGSRKRNG